MTFVWAISQGNVVGNFGAVRGNAGIEFWAIFGELSPCPALPLCSESLRERKKNQNGTKALTSPPPTLPLRIYKTTRRQNGRRQRSEVSHGARQEAGEDGEGVQRCAKAARRRGAEGPKRKNMEKKRRRFLPTAAIFHFLRAIRCAARGPPAGHSQEWERSHACHVSSLARDTCQ
jgi:hypothetical protein